MLRDKDLDQYRRVVEEAVAGTGRDDIGVGEVSERSEGVVTVEFSRGTHRHSAEIPVADLQNHESARRAITTAIRGLSKPVAQEQLDKAV
jgi:hypothetical protein